MSFPASSFAQAGAYAQIRLIGQGAEGNVYSAVDRLRRVVAVKELLPSHQGFIDRREHFEKEVRVHAALKHPNIIGVYHLEEDPQTRALYLICEHANGGSLADHLKQHGPLPEPLAIRIALDVCAALQEVADQGFVHRDIKPANILLVKDDQGSIVAAKLADFGVAKDLDRRRAGQPTTRRGGSHPGTPEYMAPEQADITRPVDARTDLYALGICLWEMLTGQDYKLAAASGSPPDLRAAHPQTSPGIAEVIQRAVQDDPAQRYPAPRVMCADLQDVRGGRSLAAPPTIAFPARRRRAMAPAAGMLTLLLATFGALWLWPRPTLSYEREGEYPDLSTVGRMVQRSTALNTMAHGQFGVTGAAPWAAQAGHVVYHNVSLPRAGHWSFKLRYSKDSPASVPIQIFLDDEPEPRAVIHPLDQGSWDSFAWSDPVDLGVVEAGPHSLKLATAGQSYGVADLDRFVLTPAP